MKTTKHNMVTQIKLSKLVLPVLILILAFSFFILPNFVLGEGQECDPNDPSLECNTCLDPAAPNYLGPAPCENPPNPNIPPGGSGSNVSWKNGSLSQTSFAVGSVSTLTGSLTVIGSQVNDSGDNGCAPGYYLSPAYMTQSIWVLKSGSTDVSSAVASRTVIVSGVEVCDDNPGGYRSEETKVDFSIPVSGLSPGSYDVIINGSEDGIKGWSANFSIDSGLSFTVTSPSTCSINIFSAGPTTPSGALLTFSLNNQGALTWDIKNPSGVVVASGTSSSGTYGTPPITVSSIYTLSCGNAMPRTVIVDPEDSPPGGGGGGGCSLDSDANRFGEPIIVPSSYILLGSCRVADYSNAPEYYDVDGSTLNIAGTCTPPANTNYIVLNIYTDDGGSVKVNGNTIHSVPPTCGIKIFELEVNNMQPGVVNNVDIAAINSELAGVGGDANFYFYSSGSGGGDLLTPVIQAPSCSNTNYSVTISWPPTNNDIRIFLDPKDFDKVLNGSGGSTPAPDGFNQRLPGGPSPLVLQPGVKYLTSIQNDSPDNGPTVEWTVPLCVPQPDLIAGSVSPVTLIAGIATNLLATISNTGTVGTGGTISGGGFNSIFQVSDSSNGANPTTSTPVPTPVLTGIQSDPHTASISKSYTFSPGTKYVRACADKSSATNPGTIPESNEDNNCGAWTAVTASCPANTTWNETSGSCVPGGGVCTNGATNYPACDNICTNGATNYPLCTITGSLPDLVVSPTSPTLVTADVPINLSAIISNTGSVSTGTGFSNIFQVSTLPGGGGEITTSSSVSAPAIPAGGNTSISKSYTFSAGTKYVRACADKSSALDSGTITESNEDNNCGAWTAVTASVVPPISTDGVCGTKSAVYPIGVSSYPNPSTYCLSGTPTSEPAFPAAGSSVSWYCTSSDSGASSGECGATSLSKTANVKVEAVTRNGGSVISEDGHINCGNVCSYQYEEGSDVVLKATPSSSYWKFSHWSGSCSGAINICFLENVVSTTEYTATAVFVPRAFQYIEF
jgi:hypothetical protein